MGLAWLRYGQYLERGCGYNQNTTGSYNLGVYTRTIGLNLQIFRSSDDSTTDCPTTTTSTTNVDKQSFVEDDEDSPMENIVETSTVNLIVTSTSNHVMDLQDYLDQKPVQSYNLPSNPVRGQLLEIPKGWIRKMIPTPSGHDKVFYYNPSGKKFSSCSEVEQYFGRLGQTVLPGLFKFEPPKSEVEEMDVDEVSSESESLGRAILSNTPTTTATMQQQLQKHFSHKIIMPESKLHF